MAKGISAARVRRELEESAAEHAKIKAALARCEATRDRRLVRAVVEYGIDKAAAGRLAGVTRQRAGQIVDEAGRADGAA